MLISRREPWPRFLLKAGLLLGLLVLAGSTFASRYKIGRTPQAMACIPGVSVFLIDTHDTAPERGAIFAFEARGLVPLLERAHADAAPLIPRFADGQILVKYMMGLPGDHVHVDADVTAVNGESIGRGLILAATLNEPAASFARDVTIPAGEYWFSGATLDSFDSRYWGTAKQAQLVGRAYPLF